MWRKSKGTEGGIEGSEREVESRKTHCPDEVRQSFATIAYRAGYSVASWSGSFLRRILLWVSVYRYESEVLSEGSE